MKCKTCNFTWNTGDGEHDCWDIVMAENARLQDELNTITTAFPGLRQRPPSMPGDNLLNYIRKAEQLKKSSSWKTVPKAAIGQLAKLGVV